MKATIKLSNGTTIDVDVTLQELNSLIVDTITIAEPNDSPRILAWEPYVLADSDRNQGFQWKWNGAKELGNVRIYFRPTPNDEWTKSESVTLADMRSEVASGYIIPANK